MLRVLVPATVRPENLELALELYRQLVAETVKEPGCLSYELLQSIGDPCELVLVEEWASQAHLDAHTRTPHFLDLVPRLAEVEVAGPAQLLRRVL